MRSLRQKHSYYYPEQERKRKIDPAEDIYVFENSDVSPEDKGVGTEGGKYIDPEQVKLEMLAMQVDVEHFLCLEDQENARKE
ncbi:MAG: hypothetical protein KJ893_05405 [Candidatus Omnitrophica bacterium]|nr:hypothetical protein [Candidatus Omnitrophota bacterium]MBU4478394.1 hypothetical protein [Candidatus Omnitrophota bacterium]MCG2704021.1 hypothetical protein [Candidatus Omnitrophota bacterium]